jgi:archaellum component FlaF (FlaF/FlaG flagellin family)
VWYWGVLRGLESVVATVLLIVVAVVGVVLVYLWFSGYLGKATSAAGQTVGPAGAAERFKVESASLAADGTVLLLIRNLGGAPVEVKTIYVYREGSLNPICVGQGVNAAIPPGTTAEVQTALTCTTSPTPGRSYVIKVVTTKGTEIAYTITATLAHGDTSILTHGGAGVGDNNNVSGGDNVGGGDLRAGVCFFVTSSGRWFGSPDGSPERGFNELNGWVAAWGPSGGGVRIALMPGITPPDSTRTGARYTVELNNVQIGNLTVSGGAASVSIEEPMPDFMEVVRIWLEPGGYVLYDNGPRPAVVLAPGTYQVKATLRVKPRYDVYGRAAYLLLNCITPLDIILLRVPNPEEWGIRVDIYKIDSSGNLIYRGTWSVGAIGYWEVAPTSSPYFSRPSINSAPKWVAYWIDPAATEWTYWAVRFTGRLYVPWSSIRVGVHHDDGITVRLCDINFNRDGWGYSTMSGTCGEPREYNVEVWLRQEAGGVRVVFIIGPDGGNEAYVPTIDGAWRCENFDWSQGTCGVSWSFVSALQSVPYFVATNYMPGSTDGGGTPQP